MFCLLVDEWNQAMCSMVQSINRSIQHYLVCFFLIFVFVYHVMHNPYMNKHDIVNSRMWSIDFNRTKVNIAIYRCIYNTVIQLHTYTVAECNDLDSASRRGRRWIICNLDVFLFGILMKHNRFQTIRALVSTPKRFQIVLGK